MKINFTFWIKSAIVLQLLTLVFHTLGIIGGFQPNNDTEKQLFSLMKDYKFDFGLGFQRSINDLMTSFSLSFSLLLLFSALIMIFY
jgi:hypothetical protein